MLARNQKRRGSFEISERWIFLAEGECGVCSGIRLSCSGGLHRAGALFRLTGCLIGFGSGGVRCLVREGRFGRNGRLW